MRASCSALILLLFLAGHARADSMNFPSELRTEDVRFGDLTITKVYDGRDSYASPQWAVEVWNGDELVTRIAGVGFEDYAISPGGSVFVGISNSGHPDTAYLVIDSAGALLSFKRHMLPMDWYCELTVSAGRKWYDGENPDVRFRDTDPGPREHVVGFSLQGCAGDLLEFDL